MMQYNVGVGRDVHPQALHGKILKIPDLHQGRFACSFQPGDDRRQGAGGAGVLVCNDIGGRGAKRWHANMGRIFHDLLGRAIDFYVFTAC